jgi:hypothetical protein
MSLKNNYFSFLSEYKKSNLIDYCKKYKIVINEDGTVFDTSEKWVYNSFIEWAQAKERNNEISYS